MALRALFTSMRSWLSLRPYAHAHVPMSPCPHVPMSPCPHVPMPYVPMPLCPHPHAYAHLYVVRACVPRERPLTQSGHADQVDASPASGVAAPADGGGTAAPSAAPSARPGANGHMMAASAAGAVGAAGAADADAGAADADAGVADADGGKVVEEHREGNLMLQLVAGSEADDGDVEDVCSVAAWELALPCFRCCFLCCPGRPGCCCCVKSLKERAREAAETTQRRLRRRRAIFLTNLLRETMGPLQALDFLVRDPISCDTNCGHAALSSVLHTALGALPHVPLIWANWLMGCERAGRFGLPSEPEAACVGTHAPQLFLFGLMCVQSVTWGVHCVAWYTNAPFGVKRPVRLLSDFVWRVEAFVALTYVVNALVWLPLAIIVDPVRAAGPVIIVLAIATYVCFALALIRRYHFNGIDGAQAVVRFMVAYGVSASQVVATLLWGCLLLLLLLVWVAGGHGIVRSFASDDGGNDLDSFWGSIFAAGTVFALAVEEGYRRTRQAAAQLERRTQSVLGNITRAANVTASGLSAAADVAERERSRGGPIKRVEAEVLFEA